MADQLHMVLDYETRSRADLKKVGAFEYSVHPSTRILCAAWRVGTRENLKQAPIKTWSPFLRECPDELIDALLDPAIIIEAHNALFEQVITANVLSRYVSDRRQFQLLGIGPEKWNCTAVLAATHGLPRNLEGACLALELPVQKDMEGRRLILKYCKPRKATKNDPRVWHTDRNDLLRIIKYCVSDVEAETYLFLALPPLIAREREAWILDQKMNLRGFKIDREMVTTALEMIEKEVKTLTTEVQRITNGEVQKATQRARLLAWLKKNGVLFPDLKAKTVEDALSVPGLLSDEIRLLLIARQAASKTSTKKYTAFEMRSRFDCRIRDFQIFHLAHTGRWGGAGVQPHNFPRGIPIDTPLAAEILKETKDLDTLRLLYGEPMQVFASCLRAVIIPNEGKRLFVADYAAIEARVLFWVAKHFDGIDAYHTGRDLYRELATVIYGVALGDVTKEMREVAKRALLGCGYGMGVKKFFATCEQFGQPVPIDLAERAVLAYRTAHAPVPELWSNLEKAAIAAVKNPGKKYSINRTTWFQRGKFLYCQLPSGRRLAYYGPTVRYEPTPWGDKRPVLFTWGVNGVTKKWENDRTWGGALTENVVQAIARDLLAEAILRIEKAGYTVLFSVHDEIVAERKNGEGSLAEFEKLMAQVPEWADQCPVRVEGWDGPRYRK